MDFLKKPISLLISIVLLVGTISFIGLKTMNTSNQRKMLDSLLVEVEEARRGSLTRDLTIVGNLEADHSVTIKPQVRGLISRVNVRGGEQVSKGDILFEVDDRSFQAILKEAKAQLKLAESAFNRAKGLRERNFAAAKSFEEAEAAFLKAQAAVEKAQKDVDDTKIRAPFTGVAGIHKISEGTPITGDLDLITVTDMDPIKVSFKVPARYVGFLSLGQRVNLMMDSIQGDDFSGRITEIDSQVDQGAQSIAVIAEVSNEKGVLKPGLFVRVNLEVGSVDNALIVPEESVIVSGDQSFVWRVIEHPEIKGKFFALRVPVLTGLQDDGRIEITRGRLSSGDLVVTVGQAKLSQDGIPVRFESDSDTADASENENNDSNESGE